MRFWRRSRNQRGAAIVEMVLVLPMLLFILFAICELSRAWFTLQLTTTAVREAARAGAVAKAADVTSVGVARLNDVLSSAGITGQTPTVVLQPLPTGDNEVFAQVDVVFTTLFPVLIPQLQSITISQSARMRHEGT